MAEATIGLVLDCADPEALGRFWEQGRVSIEDPWLECVDGDASGRCGGCLSSELMHGAGAAPDDYDPGRDV